MASGKKSKERRRAAQVKPPPPVRGRGTAGTRQASPAVLAGAAGLVALIVAAILLAVVLNNGKSNSVGPLPTNGSLVGGLPGAADVQSLLKGIPQHALTLGSQFAPVTLVEYIDPQCPYCSAFETSVMPSLIGRYVRTGKVKVEARVLAFIGPDSTRGRDAILAAGLQNKAFNLAQLLYDNQGTENTGWLDDSVVAAAAKSIPGLNPKQLFAVRGSSTVKSQAAGFDAQANQDAVKGTPTLYVGRSGGKRAQVVLRSASDGAPVVQAIQAALAA
jgi:protein-disulfide isomerase